jgi:murein DD-endopeptidase MepM/ murein hydrolase activator NlpD
VGWHYAHLQRATVAVKSGQVVRRGDVIGRLGHSGNTNGAHLHFNVTDDPSPERAQGLPFVLPATPPFAPSARARTLPLDRTLVRFR